MSEPVRDDGRSAIERIEAIYARLPTIECQGLCWNSCGPIDMSPAERERIEAAGVDIPPFTLRRSALWAQNIRQIGDERLVCPALTETNRCSVYEVRPFICRAWGVGRGEMACPHGCTMTGRRLRAVEILALHSEVMREGGAMTEEDKTLMDAVVGDPKVKALYNRYISGDRSPATTEPLLAAIEEKRRQMTAGRSDSPVDRRTT